MAKNSLKIEELKIIQELSDRESSLIGGGHDPTTLLTIGCPGNGRPVHVHYPNGTWGSKCVYDDPDPNPEPGSRLPITKTNKRRYFE